MPFKILHIQKVTGISGSENHLLTLLSRLDRERFEPHMLVLEETEKPMDPYLHRLEKAGVNVGRLTIKKDLDLSLILRIAKHIRREGFHLVHTHLIHADLYGTLGGRLAGVRNIVSTKHNDDRFKKRRIIKRLNRTLARRQKRIIAISDWIREFCIKEEGLPPSKLVTIRYGLNPHEFVKEGIEAERFGTEERNIILGTVGRLTPQKGHSYLIRALAEAIRSFPQLRLVVVGEGELENELRALARELEVAKEVIFTGPREDVERLMRGFDIFVFPSLWEGFGLVLLEAMAAEKPIIATRVSAIPEVVEDGVTGILIPPENAGALAKAIKGLAANMELARSMGKEGRRRLEEEFTVEAMVRRTEEVYDSILS